jgi:chitinase
MSTAFIKRIKYLFITALIICPGLTMAQKKEIVAYYPEFRSKGQTYYIKDIEKIGSAYKLTILNYAFVEPALDSSGNIVPKFLNPYAAYQQIYTSEMSIDDVADDSTQPLRGQFNQLRKLKARHPNIKILLSIGGWGGSKYYSDLALTPQSREKFVDACISMFIKGNLPVSDSAGGKGAAQGIFDGFDIDWEFPISGGNDGIHNNINDTKNLTALLALFREKLNEINPNLLLTEAVSARESDFYKYEIKKDEQYLNWYNVMTYDYHGSWESITNHHTNLLTSPNDPSPVKEKGSFDATIKYLLDTLGVSSNKIVPGAAFYGKGWYDVDSTNFGLYQKGKPGTNGVHVHFKNYMDFSNIRKEGFEPHWDDFAMAAWLYNPEAKVFWTYDDIKSIALKARYVDAYNLRGLMFWEITGDDTMGSMVSTIYRRNMPDFVSYINNPNNKLPIIGITKPKNNDSIKAGSNVVIETITQDDGYVAKVEFFVDDKSIGYNTIAPFDWVWFNAAKGIHEIKAEATNNNGGKTISSQVQIKITEN